MAFYIPDVSKLPLRHYNEGVYGDTTMMTFCMTGQRRCYATRHESVAGRARGCAGPRPGSTRIDPPSPPARARLAERRPLALGPPLQLINWGKTLLRRAEPCQADPPEEDRYPRCIGLARQLAGGAVWESSQQRQQRSRVRRRSYSRSVAAARRMRRCCLFTMLDN